MPVGTVKWFNEMKGFGFIQPDEGGADAFVHITAVERAGMRTLRENQRVAYEVQEDRPGKMSATNLRSVEDAEQPQEAERDAPQSDDSGNAAE
jgi:cold shock protein